MRVHLSNDDGELLASWTLPDTVTTAEVDDILSDGLWKQHQLDRCDDCGGFFPRGALLQRDESYGPEALCPACAGEAKEA